MNTNSSFQDCTWVRSFSIIPTFILDHHLDFLLLFIFRGQAKPSKKAKLNKPVNEPNPSEPEKQQPELSHPAADNIVDNPPPEDNNVDIDSMNANPSDTNPPSPNRTTNPVKPAEGKDDDVTITGHGFTTTQTSRKVSYVPSTSSARQGATSLSLCIVSRCTTVNYSPDKT